MAEEPLINRDGRPITILVTNDDGIHAPGLLTLETIARALSPDVWVVAPETEQSGKSHSLSLNDPLRLRRIDERHVAVHGTPADCVILAVRKVMPAMPDLVLSGVNRGQNMADDVTYSGTIAAAMEEQGAATAEISRNVALAARGTEELSHNVGAVTETTGFVVSQSDVDALIVALGEILVAAS